MMQFRTELFPASEAIVINYNSRIFTIGSCFTEHISNTLRTLKFNVLSNPFGIVYNPVSICNQLERIVKRKYFIADDLFLSEGVYRTFEAHSIMADYTQEETLQKINTVIDESHIRLQNTTHVIITFGASIIHELSETKSIVANNHKQAASTFQKRFLTIIEIVEAYLMIIFYLKKMNADIEIVFTISPVRHIKDGLTDNTISKSLLFAALHEILNKKDIFYFPSYELVIDDLRDYRFFEKDLVHPNAMAIDYVWEKFKSWAISKDCYSTMENISKINSAIQHRPFFNKTEQHKEFRKKMVGFTLQLQKKNPMLNFEKEIEFFT
ncbi:MAG: GSCFA domain-containing protein [Bacteroidetes bacterium]|nr:GSCFA domain-containing protein [Bacteroidota bacterium]